MNDRIKYLYSWQDWGLYTIYAVEVVQEDYRHPNYPDTELALVRSPGPNNENKPATIVPKKNLFDTYEEADAYGRENTPMGAF